ncbi:helix-turn-helix transcriptional regulator [Streptomyces sp. TRM66268-LWL]|uniref:Helix-turn-helix transcriptional regulator n=1 Tax=Streptomyces polyasparticus TaxID=2767826 RepID=A0ABR7SVF1_9ACTN|nr:LuxR C-terminal-related transcriptional regulator [Streptomyces polyasparticus]MBC9718892.1 helix-turn-helix transcriptional regulator [Streptomyces polyasparticus]
MRKASLDFLGVTSEEEGLYRQLLRQGSLTPDPATDTKIADRLVALGMATETHTGALRPVAPGRAVERLIEHRVHRVQSELEETTHACGVVDSLLKEREVAALPRVTADSPPVQQIQGMENVRAAIDELTFFVRTENLTTNPIGVLSPESIEFSRPIDLRTLRRGVRMRTLMAAPALDDPGTLAYLRELAGEGAEIRISHHPLERMIICDRAAALTPLDPANTSKGALLTREPGLVATVIELFERMWTMAKDLPKLDDQPPSDIERRILKVLYNADKDESGARELGISVRTYRKHVASLMTRLNASNRFQAALLARERGWF